MRYIKLGHTGLDVSPIAIGAMTHGEPGRGHPAWSLGEQESRPLIRHALEAGINFFDTANMYSQGSSEEILGRALKDFADRDSVVIATKVRHPMRPGPNGAGLSRKAILTEIDHSLYRLGTYYVDLYQIHRMDNSTPVEETLEALHDVVKAGKAADHRDGQPPAQALRHRRLRGRHAHGRRRADQRRLLRPLRLQGRPGRHHRRRPARKPLPALPLEEFEALATNFRCAAPPGRARR